LNKTLIVTADDVGLHRGMTLGAVAAHKRGIVTACSVVAGGADFTHAVELLRRTPSLAVGVHLTLVGSRPLCDPAAIPSLVDDGGRLLPAFPAFVRRYLLGSIRLGEIELELRRQIESVKATGLEVSHLNSHQHLHALPGVFAVVCRLAEEFKVPYVRLPVDRGPRARTPARRLALLTLGACGQLARRAAARACNATHGDGTVGVAAAGHLELDVALALLPYVSGVTELVCHPGCDQRSLAAQFAWGYEWESEVETLCDPHLREAIAETGITLASPADLRR
jgi:predicted glycoside hydrolase/deacetylase ChbG (UPF0249 family)